jgi:hypothetical protein
MTTLSTLQKAGGVKNPPYLIRRIAATPVNVLVGLAVIAQSSGHAQLATQAFEPAPGQAFYLDLDSAAGAFSQWRHDELGSLNSLRAVLRVPRIRKDRKWLPTFSIALQSKDPKTLANDLLFQVVALDGKLPMKMRLTGHVDGQPTQEVPFQTTLSLNEDLKLDITWRPQQSITIKIGGAETRAVRIGWPVSSVIVAGSTGQLKIDPLVFGTVIP